MFVVRQSCVARVIQQAPGGGLISKGALVQGVPLHEAGGDGVRAGGVTGGDAGGEQHVLGGIVVRRGCGGLFGVGEGVGGAAREEAGELGGDDVEAGVAGVAADGLLDGGVGGGDVSGMMEDAGAQGEKVRDFRVVEDFGVQQGGGGTLVLRAHPDELGELLVRFQIGWLAGNGFAEGTVGFVQAAEAEQGAGIDEPGLRGLAAFGESAGGAVGGGGELAEITQAGGEVVVGDGAVGNKAAARS